VGWLEVAGLLLGMVSKFLDLHAKNQLNQEAVTAYLHTVAESLKDAPQPHP